MHHQFTQGQGTETHTSACARTDAITTGYLCRGSCRQVIQWVLYRGKVTEIDSKTSSGETLYHIVYNDGDKEDLN